MRTTDLSSISRALLVGMYESGQKATCEEHLNELSLLAETFGFNTINKVPCPLRKIDVATYIGKGKVAEIALMVQQQKAEVVVFDEEISPVQQRNLEKAIGVIVMDRTELILGVFGQRAHTKEAKLQIELANLRYQTPRLIRLWTHLERQQGSGGAGMFVKGMGEKQIEVDRRLIHERVQVLKKELLEVEKHRGTQRSGREKAGIPTFAIIGYTNSGKSTLLNAMTDAGVLTEDKLFATLDTTTRRYTISNNQEILLIDTVGFIRKLPHLLVAAFKSTLEEALRADILLHLIDVTDPMAIEHAEASYAVLKELKVKDKPIITVFNKCDEEHDPTTIGRLRLQYPCTVCISAQEKTGFDSLESQMLLQLSKMCRRVKLCIPQSEYALVARIIEQGNVISKEYEENDVVIEADLPMEMVGRYDKYVAP